MGVSFWLLHLWLSPCSARRRTTYYDVGTAAVAARRQPHDDFARAPVLSLPLPPSLPLQENELRSLIGRELRRLRRRCRRRAALRRRFVEPPFKVARWQNLIPSFPWIVPGWRAWGRNPRKGRDHILQRSVAEPWSRSPKGQTHMI